MKKSGKTTFAAIVVMLTLILLYGGRYAEGYAVANDLRAGNEPRVRDVPAHRGGITAAAA